MATNPTITDTQTKKGDGRRCGQPLFFVTNDADTAMQTTDTCGGDTRETVGLRRCKVVLQLRRQISLIYSRFDPDPYSDASFL